MKVLTLCHELPPVGGGGGRIALELARRMVRLGHEVEILAPGFGDLPLQVHDGGLTIRRLHCGRIHREYSNSREKLAYVWVAARELAHSSTRYDLIHAHFILPAGLIARFAGQGLPYLITCHGSDVPGHTTESAREHRLMAPLWKQVVSRAGAVVSPSENLRELLIQAAPSILPRLRWIPNGYPAGTFQRSSHQPRILMVSRLIPLKGFQWFLQALEGVRLDYEVQIVGDGPLRPELERLAARTPTRVTFQGWLNNDAPQLRELYETSSIFVFPSDSENFPTVLLEAMDAGLAVVTTDVKGCPEVVGDAGLFVSPRSPQALLEATQRLIADPQAARRLGDLGRQRLREKFDWPVIEQQYGALYEEVASAAH